MKSGIYVLKIINFLLSFTINVKISDTNGKSEELVKDSYRPLVLKYWGLLERYVAYLEKKIFREVKT